MTIVLELLTAAHLTVDVKDVTHGRAVEPLLNVLKVPRVVETDLAGATVDVEAVNAEATVVRSTVINIVEPESPQVDVEDEDVTPVAVTIVPLWFLLSHAHLASKPFATLDAPQELKLVLEPETLQEAESPTLRASPLQLFQRLVSVMKTELLVLTPSSQ